jgi:hypothetical protein
MQRANLPYWINPSNTNSNAFRGVGDGLDLENETKHVWGELGFEEGGFVGGKVEAAFLEDCGDDFQIRKEHWDGDSVECDSHLDGLGCVTWKSCVEGGLEMVGVQSFN